jgi:hypothetical protein
MESLTFWLVIMMHAHWEMVQNGATANLNAGVGIDLTWTFLSCANFDFRRNKSTSTRTRVCARVVLRFCKRPDGPTDNKKCARDSLVFPTLTKIVARLEHSCHCGSLFFFDNGYQYKTLANHITPIPPKLSKNTANFTTKNFSTSIRPGTSAPELLTHCTLAPRTAGNHIPLFLQTDPPTSRTVLLVIHHTRQERLLEAQVVSSRKKANMQASLAACTWTPKDVT